MRLAIRSDPAGRRIPARLSATSVPDLAMGENANYARFREVNWRQERQRVDSLDDDMSSNVTGMRG